MGIRTARIGGGGNMDGHLKIAENMRVNDLRRQPMVENMATRSMPWCIWENIGLVG